MNTSWRRQFTHFTSRHRGKLIVSGILLIGIISTGIIASQHASKPTPKTSTHTQPTTQTSPKKTSPAPSNNNTQTSPPTPSPTPKSPSQTSSSGSSSPSSATSTTQQNGGSNAGTGGGSGTPPSTQYAQPGTQGYRGSLSALTTYSAANGQVPPGTSCSWNQTFLYLRCDDTDLTLDHVYIQGGLYWSGCGSLTLTNSIFDWYPSQSWFDVYNACTTPNTGASITASYSTFETNPSVIHYTGGSDIGGIAEYTGVVPMNVSHSLIQGFSQGFDPGPNSTISSSEIYVQDNTCNGGVICHGDGLFSQGGDNITYQYNYIFTAPDATSAIFYQSSPNSNGNSVVGNYLQGGSYALYNQNSNNLTVTNNTFGGSTYGNCSLSTGASWRTWSNNVTPSGASVVPQGNGCS